MKGKLEFIKLNEYKSIEEITAYLFKTKETELSDAENLFNRILMLIDYNNENYQKLFTMNELLKDFINLYKLDSSSLCEKLKLIQNAQELLK